MLKKISRRELAGIAGSGAISLAAATLIAQAPPPEQDWYKAALDSHRVNSEILAKFEIPMSLEPAFLFKA